MRRKILAGNWKMHLTAEQSAALATEIAAGLKEAPVDHEVVVCPTYVALDRVTAALKGTAVQVGAQDMHWENQGAFTGKVSGDMLTSLGIRYVILGHSEQRAYFQETDETVNKKVRKALADGLAPIVCVGETLEEREGGITEKVVETQVRGAYAGLAAEDAVKTVIAYEPVWAIGTGRTATSAQAQEVHKFIRDLLATLFGRETADSVRIQYGGSMKPENAAELLARPDVDGGLIGGASLKAASFLGIISSS
jgi:triosephosphate isomerase (TIM)